jgi:spore coat protein U-like protein
MFTNKNFIRHFSVVAVATLGLTMANIAAAEKNSTTFTVSSTVKANCTISVPNVTLPNYDPTSPTPVTGSGAVTVACTKSVIPTSIDMNTTTGGVRNMTGPGGNLPYNILKPAAATPSNCTTNTSAWTQGTSGGFVPASAPGRTGASYNVCLQIPAGADVTAGAYTDTVTATVDF